MEPEKVFECVSLGVSAVAQVVGTAHYKRLVIISSNGGAAWVDEAGARALADLAARHFVPATPSRAKEGQE